MEAANAGGETQGWRPEPGDVVEGVVVGLDKGWSDYNEGRFYPIVTIKTADGGLVSVHAFHAVLAKRLMAIEPGTGDKLRITFHGKRTTKDRKREVSLYTVESDKQQDTTGFWQGIGAQNPDRTAARQPSPDLPVDDDELPF